MLQHSAGDIFHHRHEKGWEPGGENFPGEPGLKQAFPRAESGSGLPVGALPFPEQHPGQKAQGAEIGQGCGHGSPQCLLPPWKEDEHKQRIEGDVEHTSQADPQAGMERPPPRPEQVGQRAAETGAQPAQHHGDQEIGTGQCMDPRLPSSQKV